MELSGKREILIIDTPAHRNTWAIRIGRRTCQKVQDEWGSKRGDGQMIALWSNVVLDEILSKVGRHAGQRFIVSESSSFCLLTLPLHQDRRQKLELSLTWDLRPTRVIFPSSGRARRSRPDHGSCAAAPGLLVRATDCLP